MLLRTLAICSLFHLGCLAIDTPVPFNLTDASGDLGCPTNPQQDLAPAPAKCAAAKGLSGDVLLCVDFDKVTGLDAKELEGWNFNLNCDDGTKWEIVDGKLQVTNLSALKSISNSCKFQMPAININDPDKVKYQSVTIAILQTVDLSEGDFWAQIFLGAEDTNRRLLAQMSGYQKRQTSSFNLQKADLPQGDNSYKYLFRVYKTSDKLSIRNWNIESIAVVGNEK